MKYLFLYILIATAMTASPAFSTEEKKLPQITKVFPDKKNKPIHFYTDSTYETLAFSLTASEIKLPLSVIEQNKDDGYIKLRINEQTVWVNSIRFMLSRSCLETAINPTSGNLNNAVSSSRAAGNGNGCSK